MEPIVDDAAASDASADGVPVQIVDYSCVTPFEEACADIEGWLRTVAAADAGNGPSRAVLAASKGDQVPWCRTHTFFYPLRTHGGGEGADVAAETSDEDATRNTNCVAELFGTLDPKPTAASRASALRHPIALHFGVDTFLLVRYDGPSSRRAPEASALLSIAATAAQQANVPIACFAPASCDDEGCFRGVLHCPIGGPPATFVHAGTFHRRALTESELPVAPLSVRVDHDTHAVSSHFRTQTVALDTLYHRHHGASPSTTVEGITELFQLNAGRTTRFVPLDGTTDRSRRRQAAISANVHKHLEVSPPLGAQWDAFVEGELNSDAETATQHQSATDDTALDPTTPRPLFLSAPSSTCGASVPCGTSVAPFRHVAVAVRWLRFDASSAAVVDNPARSSFCDLADASLVAPTSKAQPPQPASASPSPGVSPTSTTAAATDGAATAASAHKDPADIGADLRAVPPSSVELVFTWRAPGEVASIATDNVRETVSVVSSIFGSHADSGGSDADVAASAEEAEERDRAARERVYGTDVVLPTDARIDCHANAILQLPTNDTTAATVVDPLVARFAHECTHLRSVDEMYRLWLRVVDFLTAAVDGGGGDDTSIEPATPASPVERYRALVRLLDGDFVGGGDGQNGTTVPLQRTPTTLDAKLAAIAICLRDEIAAACSGDGDEGFASPTVAPLPIGRNAADGWDDSDRSMESARSSSAPSTPKGSSTSPKPKPTPTGGVSPSTTSPFDLHRHPGVGARLPTARRHAPVTPDQVRKQQRDLLAAGDSDAARRQRAHAQAEEGTALLEDMCRFKYANREGPDGQPLRPTLADFVRWYSPKDFVGETAAPPATSISAPRKTKTSPSSGGGDDPECLALLSPRMRSTSAGDNPWLAAWLRATAQPLPDLAYSPLAHVKLLLKQLAGATQEDVGTTVGCLVPAMAARRLMNARVWRLHTSAEDDASSPDFVFANLRATAARLHRAAVKAIPAEEELESACGSAAAWSAAFATALGSIETLDILTAAASTAVRMLTSSRADATVDGECHMLDGTAPNTSSGRSDTPTARWRFVDALLQRQWAKSPWARGPADVDAAARMQAHRRVRGLPASLFGTLQPDMDAAEAIPLDVWARWLAWRLLRPLKVPSAATVDVVSTHHQRQGVPSLPLTVQGRRIFAGCGVDPDHVVLAAKRVELWGYAIRPLVARSSLSSTKRDEDAASAPPLTVQVMTATFDGHGQSAYFALATTEAVAVF
eukprot:CAMPEP_0174832740 /NCGR_PEP_ID=MMETSP1114-20130205/3831_1 /TAXON_ID=312471 /ORGANISM="Neobodo designis, Strain CCAP 1951/1" /LENGTH=1239 /DNA_ID=CAMNT_0016066605 /DNA_START=107 /DNA_END=3826 /DNA_ORIENTATION=-